MNTAPGKFAHTGVGEADDAGAPIPAVARPACVMSSRIRCEAVECRRHWKCMVEVGQQIRGQRSNDADPRHNRWDKDPLYRFCVVVPLAAAGATVLAFVGLAIVVIARWPA